jgi:hypothetical protein
LTRDARLVAKGLDQLDVLAPLRRSDLDKHVATIPARNA